MFAIPLIDDVTLTTSEVKNTSVQDVSLKTPSSLFFDYDDDDEDQFFNEFSELSKNFSKDVMILLDVWIDNVHAEKYDALEDILTNFKDRLNETTTQLRRILYQTRYSGVLMESKNEEESTPRSERFAVSWGFAIFSACLGLYNFFKDLVDNDKI